MSNHTASLVAHRAQAESRISRYELVLSTWGALRFVFGSRNWISTPSRRISQLPFLAGTVAFPPSLLHESHRTGVALGGAAGDEMAPGARMPGFLNCLSLDCELSSEGPGFDSGRPGHAHDPDWLSTSCWRTQGRALSAGVPPQYPIPAPLPVVPAASGHLWCRAA